MLCNNKNLQLPVTVRFLPFLSRCLLCADCGRGKEMVCLVFLSLEDHRPVKRKALEVAVKTGDEGERERRARVTDLAWT